MIESDIDIITPENAAKLLQVTTRTIYRWLEDGELTGAKFGDKTWRIDRNSIIRKIKGDGNHKTSDS